MDHIDPTVGRKEALFAISFFAVLKRHYIQYYHHLVVGEVVLATETYHPRQSGLTMFLLGRLQSQVNDPFQPLSNLQYINLYCMPYIAISP